MFFLIFFSIHRFLTQGKNKDGVTRRSNLRTQEDDWGAYSFLSVQLGLGGHHLQVTFHWCTGHEGPLFHPAWLLLLFLFWATLRGMHTWWFLGDNMLCQDLNQDSASHNHMLDSALSSILRMLLPVISEAGTKEEMCFQGHRECLATMLQGLAEIKAEACSLPELLAFLFLSHIQVILGAT